MKVNAPLLAGEVVVFFGGWAGQAVTFNRAERAIATIKDGPTRSQLFTWADVEWEVGPSIPPRPRDC
jgi:hypothetical protein